MLDQLARRQAQITSGLLVRLQWTRTATIAGLTLVSLAGLFMMRAKFADLDDVLSRNEVAISKLEQDTSSRSKNLADQIAGLRSTLAKQQDTLKALGTASALSSQEAHQAETVPSRQEAPSAAAPPTLTVERKSQVSSPAKAGARPQPRSFAKRGVAPVLSSASPKRTGAVRRMRRIRSVRRRANLASELDRELMRALPGLSL